MTREATKNPRTVKIQFYISQEQFKEIQKHAASMHMTVTEYCRFVLISHGTMEDEE